MKTLICVCDEKVIKYTRHEKMIQDEILTIQNQRHSYNTCIEIDMVLLLVISTDEITCD